MNITNTGGRGVGRRVGSVVVGVSILGLMLPRLVPVAAAQTAPSTSVEGAPPTAPADGAAAAPPATAPAAPVEPAPAVATAAPSAAPATSAGVLVTVPPEPPKRDPYDGPPLLLAPSEKKLKLGGYGGLTVAYTRMLHRDGVLIGGEGAMLIEHRLSLGGAGYGFSRTPSGPPAADGTPREFFSGYGGFTIRYAVYSDIPLYASFGVLIGGGAITLAPHYHDDHEHQDDVEVRGYFVFQPDASLHVNMTRWLRLSLTAGYRLATAVDKFQYQADDVGGVVLGGNIQAGWF